MWNNIVNDIILSAVHKQEILVKTEHQIKDTGNEENKINIR